jgi:integrase
MARPRLLGYRVKQSKTPHQGRSWRVDGTDNGKRKIVWFDTEKEAKTYANDKNRDIDKFGSKVQLDASERSEAFKAVELLKPHGATLLDAVRFYIAHLEAKQKTKPFEQFAETIKSEINAKKVTGEMRPRSVDTYQETLRKLSPRFTGRLLSEITPEDVTGWLSELELAPNTKNRHRRYTHQFFQAAEDRSLLLKNPVKAVDTFYDPSEEEEIVVLTPEQWKKLLEAASPEIRPIYALAAYAGIRFSEIARMRWEDINFDDGSIIVRKNAAKKRSRGRRTPTIREELKPYILPYKNIIGPMVPSTERLKNLREAAQTKSGLVPWNENYRNSLRSSFISYLLALTNDENYVAVQAGNSPDVIYKNYNGLATKAGAEKYFAVAV